jgi:hypothetical protein
MGVLLVSIYNAFKNELEILPVFIVSSNFNTGLSDNYYFKNIERLSGNYRGM